MANIKGSSSIRNAICNGKHSLLPPKIPFPSIAPSFVDYVPGIPIGMKGIPKPRGVNSHHQRTSSESFLMEEQPSWLDELLNEPETPVCKAGHRRSSSDSFAYVDVATATAIDYIVQDQNRCRNLTSVPSWESQDFGHFKDVRHASFYRQQNCLRKSKNRAWHSSLVSMTHPNGLPSARDIIIQTSLELCDSQEADGVPSAANACEKQDFVESGQHDPKAISERKYYPDANLSVSETDEKRSKQQFAQRSRVRKLQYITELERNVQALQADGSEISAELEFLNQRTVILSMENKALKQRLDSLAQEQLIKCLEHEVLEREIGRLRSLYQQRQQQPFSTHGRTNSRDLDSQFANLSLKSKDAASGRETISGPLHI